jgi:hypothetical protein
LPEVLPQRLTSHISILWSNDVNSARALSACLGVIKLADKVSILNIDIREDNEEKLSLPLDFLNLHGVTVEAAPCSTSLQRTEELVERYGNENGVSLWVSGGGLTGGFSDSFYGHLIRRSSAKAQKAILIIE